MPMERGHYSEKYSKVDLRAAVGSVLKDRSSTYKASKKYNVLFNNLKRFLYASSGLDDVIIPKKGRPIALTVEEEQKLVTYVIKMQELGSDESYDESSGDESDSSSSTNDDIASARLWREIGTARLLPPSPPRFPFIGNPVINVSSNTDDVMQYIRQFIDEDFIQIIVTETNRYARQSHAAECKDTTIDEIHVFIDLVLLQSLIKKPNYQMYWTKNPILVTPIFRQSLPFQRSFFLSKEQDSASRLSYFEFQTGYVWSLIIYTGKGTKFHEEFKDMPQSSQIVLTLMKLHPNMGYCLTVDNFYTSPQFADILVSKRTDIGLYGTVRPTRKDMPPFFRSKKLKRHSSMDSNQREEIIQEHIFPSLGPGSWEFLHSLQKYGRKKNALDFRVVTIESIFPVIEEKNFLRNLQIAHQPKQHHCGLLMPLSFNDFPHEEEENSNEIVRDVQPRNLTKRKLETKRRWWQTLLYESHNQYSGTDLLHDLRRMESGQFHNFCRISETDFEILLCKIRPKISKKDIGWREAIPIQERLALTLRYLATGNSCTSLMYLFEVSKQLITRIVLEVCTATIGELGDFIKFRHPVGEIELSAAFCYDYQLVANPVHNEYQLPFMYRQATDHFRRQIKRSVNSHLGMAVGMDPVLISHIGGVNLEREGVESVHWGCAEPASCWIGPQSLILPDFLDWPPRSANFTICDNALWCLIKSILHRNGTTTLMNKLQSSVRRAFQQITPAMLRRMLHRTWRRIILCEKNYGGRTDPLLT
ncbi:hypothetical protein ANN_15522 [Periplaneta americana]|uniref:PiggyBac transposable element-derived protein domain-containing protein n=1 Tax=Periplaneta americana TaxID=6978 RepID=A0ABQ8SGU9_PERAM|nr:hypothetical protein ANN_15522 [Periplaneta americana]